MDILIVTNPTTYNIVKYTLVIESRLEGGWIGRIWNLQTKSQLQVGLVLEI
jgi:hypothetical protein